METRFSKRPTFTFLKNHYLPLFTVDTSRYFRSWTVLRPPAQRISEFWKDESQGALFLFQDFCVINESRVCNICFYFCKQIRTDDQSLSRGERARVVRARQLFFLPIGFENTYKS